MQAWFLLQQIAVQTAAVYGMPIFWFAVLLLAIQVWIRQKRETHRYGHRTHDTSKQTAIWLSVFLSRCFAVLQVLLPTILFGWCGGLIAGILLVYTGICIAPQTLLWLWGITAVLVLVQRRFVCFAYAGSIVALLQLWLYENLAAGQQVLMLVAILHFTEAVLVSVSGTVQSASVYLRDSRGRTITGVRLQMTWPLPLTMAVPVSDRVNAAALPAGYFTMPDWWPLFAASPEQAQMTALYQLVPILAAIGYQDMAHGDGTTRVRTASFRLLLYSTVLGGLVLLSCRFPQTLYWAAIVSVAGHEWIAKR